MPRQLHRVTSPGSLDATNQGRSISTSSIEAFRLVKKVSINSNTPYHNFALPVETELKLEFEGVLVGTDPDAINKELESINYTYIIQG